MNTAVKRIIPAIACLAFATLLAGILVFPAGAYAADGKTTSGALSQASTTSLTTMYTKGELGIDGMFISAGSTRRGEAVMVWSMAPLAYHPEFTGKKLTVRYYYAGKAASAKTKTVKFYDDRGGIVRIGNLKPGKTLKMQLRLSGKKDGKVYYSEWSALKSVKVAKAPSPEQLMLSTPSKGKVKATWKAPSSTLMKGMTSPTYTVRYSYNENMKSAKTKTVKGTAVTLSSLKGGKTVYVQVRTNAKLNGKIVHSPWSPRSIQVKA